MRTERLITDFYRIYTVFPFVGKGTKIIVNQSYEGEWLKATINWPAIGSVSVDETREFANGIQYATAIANLLNQGQIPSA